MKRRNLIPQVGKAGIAHGIFTGRKTACLRPWIRLWIGRCLLLVAPLAFGQSSPQELDRAAAPPRVAKPPVAAWSFDEPAGAVWHDAGGNGIDAVPEPNRGSAIQRVLGVSGNAVRFSGNHALCLTGNLSFDGLEQMSISAWVMPAALDAYREIFRKEDGEDRVLFSFQDNGTHLALGLNVGGYVECDAPTRPAQAMDGRWHHVAATFDGGWMRVYFDGVEIGRLQRSGTIRGGTAAKGYIGSAQGSECFQGVMDDLRIDREALTAAAIAAMWRSGNEALDRRRSEHMAQVETIFAPSGTFAAALAGCRKNLLARGATRDPETIHVLVGRLQAKFPSDCANFVRWTGLDPSQYLFATDDGYFTDKVTRLLDLLTEYEPLTAEQWKRITPEETRKWEELRKLRARFVAVQAQGEAGRCSPAWIEAAMEAGSRIQYRPQVHEAVAPYVEPATPETRNLAKTEARQALERDWLHQAGAEPTARRIVDEIRWTRRIVDRIAARRPGTTDFTKELARLAELEKRAAGLAAGTSLSAAANEVVRQLYFQVRELKRTVMFGNPAIDFDKLLFVDMPYPQGSEWQHETRHRLGYMAVPGARLLVLEGLSPEGRLRLLMPQPPLHGAFWRPDLAFDGSKIVFCYKPHNEKAFHLYEIQADGTGLVQLTAGIYDDLDPLYLPDGHILFSTTRGHTYVRCMPPTNAFTLARCDADGKNVYLVSYNNEPDYLASVMNDGRVLYTRWEYTDKPLWRAQKLWTMNPDGTKVAMLWGNQSVWPDLVKDARAIPGSRRVMMTGSAHHDWFAGSVGIVDPELGLNFPDGLTKVTADTPWPECGNGPVDPVESPDYHASGFYAGYYSPYPLSDQDFIVSANRNGKFVLYLMDVEGNRELIYEGTHNIFHAIPMRARALPPVIADRVAWPGPQDRDHPEQGVIFSNNVYADAPPELAGKAKYLRVLHIDEKTYTYWYKRPYLSTGPVVSAVQSDGVKRILGTVPIEADGSVSFCAPPGQALHFQLLDENHRALQTMRSFVGVMPGEYRGCLGCHESHSRAPAIASQGAALARGPSTIELPPWGEDTVSYPRYVRPVLDKYCANCHEGAGKARKVVDFTERPGDLGFSEVYWLFTGRPAWGEPYTKQANPPPGFGIANMIMVEGYGKVDPAAYRTPKPMSRLSYNSRLYDLAASGNHHGVQADAVSLQRLAAWIDAMCPYLGDEEVREIDDPVFRGVDWLSIRPRIKTAPRIVRPGPVD